MLLHPNFSFECIIFFIAPTKRDFNIVEVINIIGIVSDVLGMIAGTSVVGCEYVE